MMYSSGIPIEDSREACIAAYHEGLKLEQKRRCRAAARYYFQQAAEGGYAPAMLRIAGFCLTGVYSVYDESEVPCRQRDIENGIAWIQKAAHTGDDAALYMLARCYLEGIGVTKDRETAAYYIGRVHFPEMSDNPYDLREALVFGSISAELREMIRREKQHLRNVSSL